MTKQCKKEDLLKRRQSGGQQVCWSKNDEISWTQKSKSLWLKEADRNTNFFFTKWHMHTKGTTTLNNSWFREKYLMILEELKRKLGISQKVICDATSWRPTYLFPNFPRVINEEKEMLRGFFEESEVLRCLKLCATTNHSAHMASQWVSS